MSAPFRTALELAAAGIPVLPLRKGKVPFANCRACLYTSCGGRPNMKTPGPCTCPAPCHGWAAATTETGVITSPAWATAWQGAGAVAYHPAGAGLTVLDLDNDEAITWAQASLPRTVVVATTRGQHWLYRGTMPSANGVRPGVDIKSRMAYARWISPGPGAPPGLLARAAGLPDAVRALVVKQRPAARPVIAAPAPAGGGQCPHRAPAYLERGIAMAEQRITDARSAVHATVYGAFLAVLSRHGRCGCLTDGHVTRLFAAAQARGETARHCTDAWTNARAKLGV
ncbi:bifunctional DNA primase/polymerase [Streptomyces sp. NPDC045470]|uniref:bifunctional DNA primase/polymerase n=1 Tax=Streptomyces sp. NPDC045470 TaxID=3155469 RepID=UPI00340CAFA3